MKTDFKVYPRKIHVWFKNELTNGHWRYTYSSNAYRTCRDAKNTAIALYPNSEIKASFARD